MSSFSGNAADSYHEKGVKTGWHAHYVARYSYLVIYPDLALRRYVLKEAGLYQNCEWLSMVKPNWSLRLVISDLIISAGLWLNWFNWYQGDHDVIWQKQQVHTCDIHSEWLHTNKCISLIMSDIKASHDIDVIIWQKQQVYMWYIKVQQVMWSHTNSLQSSLEAATQSMSWSNPRNGNVTTSSLRQRGQLNWSSVALKKQSRHPRSWLQQLVVTMVVPPTGSVVHILHSKCLITSCLKCLSSQASFARLDTVSLTCK